MASELTLDELTFCQKFLEHGSASAAYRAIRPNCTAASVHTNAWRMLRREGVRKYLRELKAEACTVAGVTTNQLVHSLAADAFGDRTAIFDDRGKVRPPGEWPAELRSIVTGLDIQQTTDR